MRALVYCDYGTPDVLTIAQVEKPVPQETQVLVRVKAASVNPLDWHMIRGTPYVMRLDSGLRKPAVTRTGVDFAGVVEAVGRQVSRFKVGDEVFGGRTGALAEYIVVSADRAIVHKPANITFDQAAAVAVAGLTALQGIRDRGQVRKGQRVLINGASGGVGTFAVQIAKQLGAEVTGVCSTRNVDLVRSLGADHVIDYTKDDFTTRTGAYDVLLDNVGNRPLSACRRVLSPNGRYVLVGGGGPDDHRIMGPLGRVASIYLTAPFVDQQMGMFIADLNRPRSRMVRRRDEDRRGVTGHRQALSLRAGRRRDALPRVWPRPRQGDRDNGLAAATSRHTTSYVRKMRHLHTRSLPVTSLVARSTRAALVLGALAVLILSVAPRAQSTIKPYALESPAGLRLHNVTAEPATLDGKRGLRVRFDEALRRRLEAMTPQEREAAIKAGRRERAARRHRRARVRQRRHRGEVAGTPRTDVFKDARGFVGIAFRVQKDLRSYDAFYLRPTNGRADDQVRRNHSVQYISHPDWPWTRLRKETPEKYESYVDLVPGVWTRIRIEVRGAQARLFVHGQAQPALIVNDVKSGPTGRGAVALWIDVSTDAHFRNLTVTPE